MARYESFTFKVDREERRLLSELAARLQRSRADTIRLLVRTALRELLNDPAPEPPESGQGGRDGDNH